MKTIFLKRCILVVPLLIMICSGQQASCKTRLRATLASFTENWLRYPSPDVVLNKFRRQFPAEIMGQITVNCRQLTPENRALLGDSDPASGRAAVDRPNSSFVNWYTGCLVEYIKAENQLSTMRRKDLPPNPDGSPTYAYRNSNVSELRAYYGDSVINDCIANESSNSGLKVDSNEVTFNCSWKALSPETQVELTRKLVRKFVGPEEILVEHGLAESENAFIDILLEEVNGFNLAPDSRYLFLQTSGTTTMQPGTLSVNLAVMILKTLIGVQDTLMY